MNITNNPYYVCLTSARNPYVDRITFKPDTSEFARINQTKFLFDKICCFTNIDSITYITGSVEVRKPSAFYTFIMNEVDKNPKKYGCTRKELEAAYIDSLTIFNAISVAYKKNKKVSEHVFKNGITVLNEKYHEDIIHGRLNPILFVDGMKKMKEDLAIYKRFSSILGI